MMRLGACALFLFLAAPSAMAQSLPAFPGAEGFGAIATGGRGGRVIYVTTLAADPQGILPGSFNWALRQEGPRNILFKVSGVIDARANIVHGDLTIAGQTSPGGVIVRGMICDGHYDRNDCSNAIVRHLRLRPAWNLAVPPGGDRLDDGLRLDGIRRFIFDHVSIANAEDEAVQVSWASDGTIQYSMLGETVGGHANYGGMLMNYSHPDFPQTRLSFHHNLWYRLGGRFPEVTCESSSYPGQPPQIASCQDTVLELELTGNVAHDAAYFVDHGKFVDAVAANGPYRVHLNMTGNQWTVRPTFPFGMVVHDFLQTAQNRLFVSGNTLSRYSDLSDYQLFYCCNDFAANGPNTDLGVAQRLAARNPFPPISSVPRASLVSRVAVHAGALPHDPLERRYAAATQARTFSPRQPSEPDANDAFALDFDPLAPPLPPVDLDNDGMPDAFELQFAALGLNPAVADHNGSQLSVPFTGVAGYTNLECYLNWLADRKSSAAERIFADSYE